MAPSQFQLYKFIGVVAAFSFSAIVQRQFPYGGDTHKILRNWKTNLCLGAVAAIFLAAICEGCVCTVSDRVVQAGFGLFPMLQFPLPLQIFFSIFILDGVAYGWHRANHRFRSLWRFHSVHHSDTVFDCSTAVRFHPGELLISLGVRLLIVATIGIPVAGLLSFEILYAFFNFFEHGDTRLAGGFERVLATLFITPALHRKHHSQTPRLLNSNYGTIFSVWDRTFGTFIPGASSETIAVGLEGMGSPLTLWQSLRLPFRAP